MKNKNTKKLKFKYILDITTCETYEDIVVCNILNKYASGKKLTKNEVAIIVNWTTASIIDNVVTKMFGEANVLIRNHNTGCISRYIAHKVAKAPIEKKPNIFKRIWNWVTGK